MTTVKSVVLFCLLAVCMAAGAREVQTVNESWQFAKASDGKAPLSGAQWTTVDLPHTWNISDVEDEPYGWYRGKGFYTKHLNLSPRQIGGGPLYLCFEGANQVTTVSVNGVEVGKHIGGYTPFRFNITPYVHEGENELSICVDNSHDDDIAPQLADYVFYGGIYRDVKLLQVAPLHFSLETAGSGVRITTPVVGDSEVVVRIESSLQNESQRKASLTLVHRLYDADFRLVASLRTKGKITPNGTFQSIGEMKLPSPQRWSPDTPYLYSLESVVLDEKGEELDRVTNPVGIRTFEFDPETGFRINGKSIKLVGTNRHQDHKGMGNALGRDMHLNDMQMLKDLGINCLRISHYPHDPVVLEMCDRMGFVAFEEIPVIDWITQSERFLQTTCGQITEMIDRDFNHPCIVSWNSSNESNIMRPPHMKNNDEKGYRKDLRDFLYKLYDHIRQADPSRPCMVVLCGDVKDNAKNNWHAADIIGYNKYEGWYDREMTNIGNILREFHETVPDRPFFLTEYGAGADWRIHTTEPRIFDHSMEYQILFIKEHLKAIYGCKTLSGATYWNFADFYSEGRGETQPHINNKGLVTVDRRKKDSYYLFKTHLSATPYVSIPSQLWTLRSGREDSLNCGFCTQDVEVFSNTETVELFLNGKSLGKKHPVAMACTYSVPFVDGENLLELVDSFSGQKDFLRIVFRLIPYDLRQGKMPLDGIAVNVGSHFSFSDDLAHGRMWLADKPYEEGSWGCVQGEPFIRDKRRGLVGSARNISGTTAEPLFQTQLRGLEGYRFDVPAGRYELDLLFAELDEKTNRVFDVYANGELLLENFSLAGEYEPFRAVSKRFEVTVKGEEGLLVSFVAKEGEAVLNGISVRKIY